MESSAATSHICGLQFVTWQDKVGRFSVLLVMGDFIEHPMSLKVLQNSPTLAYQAKCSAQVYWYL
jgi:hypothetical protein